MKKLFLLLSVLILCMILLERQAGYCGAGWWSPDLPYSVQPDWFNGAFVLNDAEGWGAVTNLSKLQTSDSRLIGIKRVLRYAYNDSIYVEIESSESKGYYVIIDGPNFQQRQLLAYSNAEFDEYKNDNNVAALSWISVDTRSCFFGLFNAAKIALALTIVLLASTLMMRRRPQV